MVTIQGDKELIQKLQALKKTQAKTAIGKGTRAGAKIVQAAAKQNAPVLSGQLKRSIKVRSLPRSKKAVGTQVIESADFVGFVEFGTKHQQGEHKFEEAAKGASDEAIQTMLEITRQEIDKAMKK